MKGLQDANGSENLISKGKENLGQAQQPAAGIGKVSVQGEGEHKSAGKRTQTREGGVNGEARLAG